MKEGEGREEGRKEGRKGGRKEAHGLVRTNKCYACVQCSVV